MPVLVMSIILVSFLQSSETRPVDGMPQFLIKPNSYYVEPTGVNIKMRCRATDESNAIVEWFRGGDDKHPLRREGVREMRYVVKRDGTLVIKNTTTAAEGFYHCTIKNEFGTKKARVAVAIITWPEPAEITGWKSHIVATAGRNVTIPCQADSLSDGIVSIYWESDTDGIYNHYQASGKPLPPNVRVYAQSISAFQSELRITHAKVSDGGIYTCILNTLLYPRSDVRPVELTLIEGNEPVNSVKEFPPTYVVTASPSFQDK